MTIDIFTKFCAAWETLKKTKRKVPLLLDNCSAHPPSIPSLHQIKIVILPPNTTSRIQPLDAGIIKNFKHHYRTHVLKKQVYALDHKAAFDLNVKEAIFLMASAWNLVTSDTIRNCFRHAQISRPVEDVIEVETDSETTETTVIELLKSHGVTLPETFDLDDFTTCNDSLLTCKLPSDDDIIS
jgi:hypothetical protein